MNTLHAPTQSAAVLAQLLDQLDASRSSVDAHQYRTVVERLTSLLADTNVDWQPLLDQSPAAAALYENLHYADAGLCRTPLDAAVQSEISAREAIARIRRKPAADAAPTH